MDAERLRCFRSLRLSRRQVGVVQSLIRDTPAPERAHAGVLKKDQLWRLADEFAEAERSSVYAGIRCVIITLLYSLCLGAGVASLLWIGDHIKIYTNPIHFVVE